MPPTVTISPSRRRSRSVERAVGLPPQLALDALERMLRDVEAERLLLEAQQLALVELARRDRRVVPLGRAHRRSSKRRRRSTPGPRCRSWANRWPSPSALSSTASMPDPAGAGRVERSALDERLERALVHGLRVGALGELPDRLERAALAARPDDRLGRSLSDVLDGVQAEADLAFDDREVGLRRVDVRRQHLDAHLVARVDVERHAVLRVHDGRDQGGHVLVRVVRLEPGGAVRDERVAGGMRLVERVVLGRLHVLPELLRDRLGRRRSPRSPRGTCP